MYEINLEENMPTSAQAIEDLKFQLKLAKDYNLVRIIHGYGSSGKGGIIRKKCREYLMSQKQKGNIKYISFGEDYNMFSETARHIKKLDTKKETDKDYSDCCNHGVTYLSFK